MNRELEQLGERIAEQAAHFDAAMHRLLTDLREFDERGGWHPQGSASCAHWLTWRVGWDLVTARDRVRVSRKLAEFPAIDDALRRGEVSYSKVRAMLRVATPANEVLLLDRARLMTASQLEKLCRKYALVQRHDQDLHPRDDKQRRYVRRRDTEDGMVKIEAVLHPEEAELVWLMLDHAAAQLAHEPSSTLASDSEDTWNLAELSGSGAVVNPPLQPVPCGNDSAESPEEPSAFATTATMPFACIDSGRIDDSAEAHAAHSTPCVTATAPSARRDGSWPYDSAESPGLCSASDTVATGSLAHVDQGAGGGSAEARAASAPSITATAPPACLDRSWPHDSAESPDLCSAPSTAATGLTGPRGCVERKTDSARAPQTHRALRCGAAWPLEFIQAWDSTGSVNSYLPHAHETAVTAACSQPPSRSLLDRLLDEAEALREAESPCRGEVEASARELPPEHQTSLPRERADVTRRAFHRADALVSLAQG